MKRVAVVVLIVGAIGAGAGAYYMTRSGVQISVLTAPITRGDITDTVGATGTLQAVTTVQVGSQVSGNIAWLGADFNSIVRRNQVIAKLDPSLFQAQVEQARANLLKSQADLERNTVALGEAQQKHARASELAVKGLVPQSELDAAKAAVDSAKATLKSSQATVEQANATLNQNQVSLDHTVITAPIDGIVTQRSVDVGQTVAASLQSPTLFIIAADLTKMQVNANIDEADVGRIRPSQHVTFRVDAYPAEQFDGAVAQIRLQPVVVSNVTTYVTVIDVPNPQLKLKPGMTANVKVEVAQRRDALRVPNAAIRFRPTPEVFAALNQPVPTDAQIAGGRGGRGAQAAGAAGSAPVGAGAGSGAAGPAVSSARTGAPATSVRLPSPGASTQSGPAPGDSRQPGGRRGFVGGGGMGQSGGNRVDGGRGGNVDPNTAGGSGQGADRRAAIAERLKTMSPEEQKQVIARLKERGQDVSAFEQAPRSQPSKAPVAAVLKPKSGSTQAAETIDALFAPLPPVETRGRVWLFMNNELKPVNVRLGISDGTNTELLGGELQQNMEVVTGVTGIGSVRPQQGGGGGSANPLLPQRGGPPGGFSPPPGRGR